MWINNNNELKKFEAAIDNCTSSVWAVTGSGNRYDLKETAGRYLGLASMLSADEYSEPEIFTENYEDQATLFAYLQEKRALQMAG